MTTKEEELRKECWNRALLTLGTSYVFSKKVALFKKLIRIITVLGIVVPLLLGSIVATYGAESNIIVWALIIAAPVSIVQLVLSGVSLVYKWDDILAYSLESQSDNRVLSDEYQSLAKFPPTNLSEFETKLEILKTKETARTNQDDKITFSDKENRLGMRYGLLIFKRKCEGCKEQPVSMKSSKCDICGNF